MRNVEVIRQSISKVTQMLAGMKIEVTQRGDQAAVKYDGRTGKAVRVNIPFLPDAASDELIAAVQGFLDHEVAHILFSDAKAAAEAYAESKRLGITHNIVEDCFIEVNMEKRFKGSAMNLSNVRRLVFVTRSGPQIEEMIARGMTDEPTMFKALSVTVFRALAGQPECKEFLDDGDKWRFMPNILKALSFYEFDIQKCKTSWDTLDLARKVLTALEKIGQDEEETQDEEKEENSGGGGSDGDCDSDTKSKSKSKSKDDTGAEEESDDSEEGDGKPDDEEGDEEGKSESGGDEGDEEGESENAGDDEEADDEEEASSGGDDDSDGDDTSSSETTEEAELILSGMDEAKDFAESVAQEVTNVYQNEAAEGKYGEWIIFSREYDEPTEYDSTGVADYDVIKMNDRMNAMVGPMAKQLERLILARKRSTFEPGKRSGRLHTANLHRLTSGDDRVFRRKFDTAIKDTAVEILIDMSGSMGGDKMETAAYSGFALASMLQRVNIPVEVMSFTTDTGGSRAYFDEMNEASKRLGRSFSHTGVCTHLLLKGFNERVDNKVAKRFAHLGANKSRLMSQNCDPESVYAAGIRLAKRPEQRRVLMVLSDGHPAFSGDYAGGFKRLKSVVKDCEGAGLDVIGIGIQDRSVEEFYPKHVVLHSASELPKAIMGEMQALLLR